MKIHYILLVSAIYAIGSCNALAEIYRWVDSNGKVHFSDKPQGDQTSAIKPTGSSSTSKTEDSYRQQLQQQQRLLDAYSEKRAHEQRQKAAASRKQQEKQAKIDAACKGYARYLEMGGSIYRKGEDGKRIYLKESEIEAFHARKKAEYDQHCK